VVAGFVRCIVAHTRALGYVGLNASGSERYNK
jgi:hypothetical protein